MGRLGKLGLVDRPVDVPALQYLDLIGSDRFTLPGWNTGDESIAFAHVAHVIYFIPILVVETRTFDRIGVDVNGAGAGGDISRLGIYSAKLLDSGLTPDVLLLDAGTVAINTTGDKLITISHTLAPGYYFLAYVTDTTTGNLVGIDINGNVSCPVTGSSNAVAGGVRNIVPHITANAGVDYPSNGLPDPAPNTIEAASSVTSVGVKLRDTT